MANCSFLDAHKGTFQDIKELLAGSLCSLWSLIPLIDNLSCKAISGTPRAFGKETHITVKLIGDLPTQHALSLLWPTAKNIFCLVWIRELQLMINPKATWGKGLKLIKLQATYQAFQGS